MGFPTLPNWIYETRPADYPSGQGFRVERVQPNSTVLGIIPYGGRLDVVIPTGPGRELRLDLTQVSLAGGTVGPSTGFGRERRYPALSDNHLPPSGASPYPAVQPGARHDC